jgi:molecular chaperone GrpE
MSKRKDVAPGQLEDGSFDLSGEEEEFDPATVEQSFTQPDEGSEAADEMSEQTQQLVDELQASLAEALAARQRALADYANYQRRATENEERIRCEAVRNVVRAFLPVLDQFSLALGQDTSEVTVEQLMDGLELIRAEFIKGLDQLEAVEIYPEPGEEFDPNRHQAVMRTPTDEQEPNTIVSVLQVGYEMGEVILRPATVAVAAAPDAE